MPKLSHLSDEDLDKMITAQGAHPQVSHLDDDELDRMIQEKMPAEEERPWYSFDPKNLGAGLEAGAKKIDSVTGAPMRAGISAAQDSAKDDDYNPISDFTSAFKSQFNEDPDLAPTGQDIVRKAGVPEGMSKSTGFMMDLAADPTNFIPAGTIEKGLKEVPGALRGFAEHSALNATGATGKQAAEFAPGAGRELLDRGIVQFGDSQSQIAKRAASAVDKANQEISASLKALDANGVKVDGNRIYNTVRDKITELRKDSSMGDVADGLEKELDNLVKSTEAKGTHLFDASEAEKVKRGYNRKSKNWADPEKGMVGKEMYRAFKNGVEDVAQAEDPGTADLFKEAKKSYGLLDPIEEAAQRRAMTTNQHPAGGFLDTVGAAGGYAAGGPGGAILTPIARRVVSPRIASTVATTADAAANVAEKLPKNIVPAQVGLNLGSHYRQEKGPNKLAQIIKTSPQSLGKYAPALQKAMERGDNAFGVTDYMLQQSDPAYREMKRKLEGDNEP